VQHLSLKIGRDAAEIGGEMPHLNKSKSVKKIMHIHFRVLKIVCFIVLSSN